MVLRPAHLRPDCEKIHPSSELFNGPDNLIGAIVDGFGILAIKLKGFLSSLFFIFFGLVYKGPTPHRDKIYQAIKL